MHENPNAEPVENPQSPMASVVSTLPPTETEAVNGGDETKWEYEFTNLWEGCLYCVHLYDTNDVSACERVINRPVKAEELSYSDSGNGFIVDDGFKYTFKRSPFARTFTNIHVATEPEPVAAPPPPKPKVRVMSVEELLAGL